MKRTVYVISDLHLGGDPEFRMMTHPDKLAAFIGGLAGGGGARELVINGDFIDFLAEKDSGPEQEPAWVPFRAEPREAVACLHKIAKGMDAPVFAALGALLDAGHRLTILPGNHDIELCLPAVRAAFERHIGLRPTHDYRFIHDGEGYAIGDVLIEHGNRYDSFNVVDHERLHQVRVKQTLGQYDPKAVPFAPPLGSVFVARVMNHIKQKYAFIDLLQPSGPALAALLLALDPHERSRVRDLARMYRAYRKRRRTAEKRWEREEVFRGGGDPREDRGEDPREVYRGEDPYGLYRWADGGAADVLTEAGSGDDGDEGDVIGSLLVDVLGDDAFTDVAAESAPVTRGGGLEEVLTRPERRDATRGGALEVLGQGGWEVLRLLVGGRAKQIKRLHLLRSAIRKLGDDPSFDRDREPEGSVYLERAEALTRRRDGDGGFRHVVFGHTHHAKDVALSGGGRYLNSGTWANLMRFPRELFDPEVDDEVATSILEGFLADLKDERLDEYVLFAPSYVEIEVSDEGRVTEIGLRFPFGDVE
jgi:UDP-2,3-diacylglucosamine pyrophosphatase LpxH